MAKNDLQGTLDLLVLKTLAQNGTLHGYGIVLHIQNASGEVLRVEEGSLYPALHRMEQSGWIAAEWAMTETNRRAKYYKLTATGRRQLQQAEESFEQLVKGVRAVLRLPERRMAWPDFAGSRTSFDGREWIVRLMRS